MYVNVMSITVINDICNDIDNYTRQAKENAISTQISDEITNIKLN